jgi:hypothetical protein
MLIQVGINLVFFLIIVCSYTISNSLFFQHRTFMAIVGLFKQQFTLSLACVIARGDISTSPCMPVLSGTRPSSKKFRSLRYLLFPATTTSSTMSVRLKISAVAVIANKAYRTNPTVNPTLGYRPISSVASFIN